MLYIQKYHQAIESVWISPARVDGKQTVSAYPLDVESTCMHLYLSIHKKQSDCGLPANVCVWVCGGVCARVFLSHMRAVSPFKV